jgi:molecular chaperone DnaK (HSP70)
MSKKRKTQGEHSVASHNTPLGSFLVTDLKSPAPDEIPEITVQFDLDANGILKVTALHFILAASGKSPSERGRRNSVAGLPCHTRPIENYDR